MSTYVVDANVAAKWFTEEELTDQARALLHPGNQLYAPDFFFLEMDSLLCRRVRRRDLTASDARDIRAKLRVLPVEYEGFAALQDQAFETAIQSRRSPYDCLYLIMAVVLDGRMVTADRRFYDAIASGPLAAYMVWLGDLR